MAEDTAEQDHDPPKQTETFGPHGRVQLPRVPAGARGALGRLDERVLYAEGDVLQATVFGEELLLRRRIEAQVGESQLLIRDEVVNVGHDRTPKCSSTMSTPAGLLSNAGSEELLRARDGGGAEGRRRR